MSHRDDGEAAVIIDGHDNGVPEATATNEDRSDREPFFQCLDGVEPSGPARAHEDDPDIFPSDDGEEDGLSDDVRVSFATAVGDELQEDQALLDEDELEADEEVSRYDYDMWMEADDPVPIKERRRRLLQGMGLNSSKDLLRSRIARTIRHTFAPDIPRGASRRPAQLLSTAPSAPPVKRQYGLFMKRCRSDNRLAARGGASRKPPPPLRRVSSVPHALQGSPVHMALRPSPSAASKDERGGGENRIGNGDDIGHSLRVKNLDGDNEMPVSGGQSTDGAVDNAGTGEQLSVGEFERFVGCPPLVTQLMRRSQSQPVPANKDGGKKKPRWLKNIKLVATAAGLLHEKDRNRDRPSALPSAVTMAKSRSAPASASASASAEAADSGAATPSAGSSSSSSSTTERLKVHHSGKSSKDLTGLYMRQEVRAHEGSIWSIKFSADGRFLATGGEDRVVRVWQVVDADASSSSPELCAALFLPPLAPTEGGSLAAAPGLAAQLSKKVRRKSSKHVLPDHVVVPDTLFALAEKPACEFEGHVDDVLDLSWSRQSPRLLSSSMDKTVRLWDVESKTCLKVFTHSDYVTCIQFNPADDGYFISGSLDCKVRIWSVADRQVVDWSDLTDMVTAACYTPDGQAAIVGSHKGCCRFYKTRDCKLNQEAQIDMSISKKRKSQAKKITGFQFAPGNPSEILVTSADSQIRVFNGITVLQKFKGTPPRADAPHHLTVKPTRSIARTPQRNRAPVFLDARVQEHQQPALGHLLRRRPLRRLRQRGLARLRLEARGRRHLRRGRWGRRDRRQGQDVAHQPLLRVLLLQGRVGGGAVARLALHLHDDGLRPRSRRGAPLGQRPRRQQEVGRRRAGRRGAVADASQVRADDVHGRAGADAAQGSVFVVVAGLRRQRVGDGGGDGQPGRGDQGVPELRDAAGDQRAERSLPLATARSWILIWICIQREGNGSYVEHLRCSEQEEGKWA